MKYQIVLTSVIWTPDYKNVRRFSSRAVQETYFDVANKFTSAVPVRNLDYGNFTRLSVLVKTGQAGIGDIMSANYAIIKDVTNANSPKYWYYFITNSTFDSVDQTRLDLVMDVMQSYYIDMTFGKGIIERAHLNRWTINALNRSIDSGFFTRDELKNIPKRVKNIVNCTTSPWQPDNDLSKWLNNNIYAWVYAYLDAGTYTHQGGNFSTLMTYSKRTNTGTPYTFTSITSPYIVLCCPILKDSTKTFKVNNTTINLSEFFDFVIANKAHIYNIKLTQFTPFSLANNYVPTAVIEDSGNTFNITSTYNLSLVGGSGHELLNVIKQYLDVQYLTYRFNLPQASISKQGITTYSKDLEANPKIYNSDYRGLKVVYGSGEYEFDIQKLYNSAKSVSYVDFVGFEILTPEIAPTFISIDSGTVGSSYIYNNTDITRIGYIAENDFTLPYSTNQLEAFLANNKNFYNLKESQYNQMKANRAISGMSNAITGIAAAGASGVAGDIGGAVKQGLGSIFGVALSAFENEVNINYDKEQTAYTIDNMQSGVDTLRASSSNAYFLMALMDCKIVLQELEGLPNDINRALEDMHQNGYVYQRLGDVKSFDNIRSKWNYVKALVEIIKTPVKIPNEVRQTIQLIFANGVRFWNTDTWDFDQINLENT